MNEQFCSCGDVTYIKSTGECRRCYARTYYHRRKAQGGALPPVTGQCTYHAAHDRLYKRRGSASAFTCCDCDRQAEQWSYNNASGQEQSGFVTITFSNGQTKTAYMRWSGRVEDYSPRCRDCHRAFDAAERQAA